MHKDVRNHPYIRIIEFQQVDFWTGSYLGARMQLWIDGELVHEICSGSEEDIREFIPFIDKAWVSHGHESQHIEDYF